MIESVESNWKGSSASESWKETLGTSTLITGPNGAGKSRVAEAIELALTGQVSNYLGRGTVKDPKMLWRAKGKMRGPLFVELGLKDGRVVRWEQGRSNGKPARTIDGEIWSGSGLGTVFGVAEVRANLFGSPKKAEQWLSGKLGLTLDEVLEGMKEKLDPETFSFAVNLKASALASNSFVDAFLAVLKKGAREAKAEAKAAQALVEELEHVSGSYVTDDELAKAKKAITDANAAVSEAQVMHDRVQQLAEAHTEYQRAGKELTQLSEELAPAQVGGLHTASALRTALTLVRQHYPKSSACPCCHAAGVDGEAIDTRLRGLNDYIDHMEEIVALVNRRAALEVTLGQAKARGEKLLSLIPPKFLSARKESCTATALEVAQLRHGQARAHLDELQRRRLSSQSPGMAQATVDEKLRKSELYQTAADCMEKVVKEKVATTLEAFNTALKQCYPEHFGTPVLTLRPQVSVSVKRGGITGVPSGGEEALLLLAIAGVLSYLRTSEGGQGLNLLVMEDRGVDVETLDSILALWKEQDAPYAQILVPTTTQTFGTTDGWKVLSYWPTESERKISGDGDYTYNVDPFDLRH